MPADRKLCDGLPSAPSRLDPTAVPLHYDVPQCGALLCGFVQYRVACFCVVLYNVLCGVVHSWPELATQLSLNYQIIPHIPRDHTGHLSLQAHS